MRTVTQVTETLQEPSGLIDAAERDGVATIDGEPRWLTERRNHALGRFLELGLPTTKDEAWKYTDVAPLRKTAFTDAGDADVSPDEVDQARLPGLKGPVAVLVNGRFRPELSRLDTLDEGVLVTSLAAALRDDATKLEADLGTIVDHEESAFNALNLARFTDGLLIELDDGVVLAEPLQVVSLTAPSAGPTKHHARVLVRLGAQAEARVVETARATGDGVYFASTVTEIRLGDGATFEQYLIQQDDAEGGHRVATTQVDQGRDSTWRHFNGCFGGALVRNDINTVMTAEGGEASLDGLFMLGGSDHTDNHTHIDHAVPHGSSQSLYKGVFDGDSQGVFYGKVDIRPGAQKTTTDVHNPNLILSRGAHVDSTPGLEISADDVKAAHGSTIGQLDKDALFYLRTRGLDETTARSLLTYGFANEVVDRVRIPAIRQRLDEMILARLPGGRAVEEAIHGTDA